MERGEALVVFMRFQACAVCCVAFAVVSMPLLTSIYMQKFPFLDLG